MRKAVTSIFTATLATICLAGCAMTPIHGDQNVVLGPQQGLVAVVFSMPESIYDVNIAPADATDSKLTIDSVPKGESIYLFVVPAGKYCLNKFYTPSVKYHSVGHSGPCFQVAPGKLNYSGEIGPYELYGQFVMLAKKHPETFHVLLRRKYPKIAAQFLPAE